MDEKKKPCIICGSQISEALVSVHICREDLNRFHGLPPYENHHPESRANSPETIHIPANIHAMLTAMQVRWAETLKSVNGDPVIQIARRIQVTQDFIECLSRLIQRDSNFLLALSLAQQEHNGPDWWKRGGVAPLINEVPDGN